MENFRPIRLRICNLVTNEPLLKFFDSPKDLFPYLDFFVLDNSRLHSLESPLGYLIGSFLFFVDFNDSYTIDTDFCRLSYTKVHHLSSGDPDSLNLYITLKKEV